LPEFLHSIFQLSQNNRIIDYKQMNFTNIISVGKDWSWYKVWGEAKWPVKKQVNEQVENQVYDQVYVQVLYQVYDQITQIKYKIHQEKNK